MRVGVVTVQQGECHMVGAGVGVSNGTVGGNISLPFPFANTYLTSEVQRVRVSLTLYYTNNFYETLTCWLYRLSIRDYVR